MGFISERGIKKWENGCQASSRVYLVIKNAVYGSMFLDVNKLKIYKKCIKTCMLSAYLEQKHLLVQ